MCACENTQMSARNLIAQSNNVLLKFIFQPHAAQLQINKAINQTKIAKQRHYPKLISTTRSHLTNLYYMHTTHTAFSALPSVLWCCWLGIKKGIRACKNWVVGCWHGYLSAARCRLIQLMQVPFTVSCFSKIQIAFSFLLPVHPGSAGQRAVKWVCVPVPDIH